MLSDAGCIGLSPARQPIARASPTACYSAGYQSRLGLGGQLEWRCPGKSHAHYGVGGPPVPAAGPVTATQVQVVGA